MATITHEPEVGRFVIKNADGKGAEALLEYVDDGTVWDMQHTFSPPACRGQGLAAQLCVAAFDAARAHQRKVIPSCSYISDNFLPTHSQYAGDVVDNSSDEPPPPPPPPPTDDAAEPMDKAALIAAIMEDEAEDGVEDGGVDLGAYLTPLSRDQLEMLVVRMLAKHPVEFDAVVAEVQFPVDMHAVHAAVAAALDGGADDAVTAPELAELNKHAERAAAYLKVDSIANAQSFLYAITDPLVDGVVARGAGAGVADGDDEARKELERLFATLENAWTALFASPPCADGVAVGNAAPFELSQCEHWFKQLAAWRASLTPLLGPLFSDPLRTLKKRLKTLLAEAAANAKKAPVGSASLKRPANGNGDGDDEPVAKKVKK
jgi:predicted GNAT family acetyltransferase